MSMNISFTHFLRDALNELCYQHLPGADESLLLCQSLQVGADGGIELLLALSQCTLLELQGTVPLEQLIKRCCGQVPKFFLALLHTQTKLPLKTEHSH